MYLYIDSSIVLVFVTIIKKNVILRIWQESTYNEYREKFKDTNRVIGRYKSTKDRQCNSQKIKNKQGSSGL